MFSISTVCFIQRVVPHRATAHISYLCSTIEYSCCIHYSVFSPPKTSKGTDVFLLLLSICS